jgi:hypothetical protein
MPKNPQRQSDSEYAPGRKEPRDEAIPEFDNPWPRPPEPETPPTGPPVRGRSSTGHDRGVRHSEIRRETQTSAAMGRLPGTNSRPDG